MRVEHALTYCSILNGPNVTRPFCNTLTYLIVVIIYFASLVASPLRPLKGMDLYVSLRWPSRNVVVEPQFLIHTSCRSE